MAMLGMSIGSAFMLAMVLGPLLDSWIGVPGIFALTAVLGVAGALVVLLPWGRPRPLPDGDGPARLDERVRPRLRFGENCQHRNQLLVLARRLVIGHERLGGLHPTDMIVLAARPAMGKTAFALNLARNAAERRFFSRRIDELSGDFTPGGILAGLLTVYVMMLNVLLLGGLTVLRALHARLPGEDLIYFGDTARVPYGTKGELTVRGFARQDAGFLAGLGALASVFVIAASLAGFS